MSKYLPSKVNVNGIVGKPAGPTVAPGGSAAAASCVAGAGVVVVPAVVEVDEEDELEDEEADELPLAGGVAAAGAGAAVAAAPLLAFSLNERKSTFELSGRALELVDERGHVVVDRHGLAEAGHGGVVAVVLALGRLRLGTEARAASRRCCAVAICVDGLDLGPLGREDQEPEAAQQRQRRRRPGGRCGRGWSLRAPGGRRGRGCAGGAVVRRRRRGAAAGVVGAA